MTVSVTNEKSHPESIHVRKKICDQFFHAENYCRSYQIAQQKQSDSSKKGKRG